MSHTSPCVKVRLHWISNTISNLRKANMLTGMNTGIKYGLDPKVLAGEWSNTV